MLREVPETYTTTDLKADYILVDGPASGFPSQALIPSQHPGDPNDGQPSALPSACRAITSAFTQQVAALELQQQKPAGPPTATPSVEPAALILSPPATPNACTHFATPITAPTAPPNQRAPQKLPPTDLTLPLDDRISRLENAVLCHMSTINVQHIVAEVVQAVQAWALTQFHTKSTCSHSASTGSSSAPRRRKVAGSSSPALNQASVSLPAPRPGAGAWRMTHKILTFIVAISSSTPLQSSHFEIVQWNSRGFGNRGLLPAVIALQESGPHPTLSSYCSYVGGTTSSVLVHKSYTDVQVDLDLNLPYDYCMISVLPQGHFRGTLLSGSPGGGSAFFMVVGDFNAPSTHWGYHFEKSRGRKLKELIYALGFTMLTDSAHPTRLGNSGPTSQRANDLCDRYLSRTVEPIGPEYIYSGLLNTEIDAPFALAELRAAFAKMKQGTAPGRDGITGPKNFVAKNYVVFQGFRACPAVGALEDPQLVELTEDRARLSDAGPRLNTWRWTRE
ncbi:hypothetical protein HPB52_015626 [Rhipicephalus sanguineus]|uniref:Endonuclease/exonuclease/phosphatase domain-containing protein n=1 Tax=Rhipicephalus sanguineus TaxID=34632 RepID=A0A9D4PSZ1_RHISA|nr:hypothetical protein HPB52_015626 [Rhipicephalus sanguineus]